MEALLDDAAKLCLKCRSPLQFRLSRFGCIYVCQCRNTVIDGQKVVREFYSRIQTTHGNSLGFFPIIELYACSTANVLQQKLIFVELECEKQRAVATVKNFTADERAQLLCSLSHALQFQVVHESTEVISFPLELYSTLEDELYTLRNSTELAFQLSCPSPQLLRALGNEPPSSDGFASALPDSLRCVLRQHQLQAVRQAVQMNGRVLIADEMGVGKTLEAIGVISVLRAYPVLIVAPSALKLMWAEEIEKYLPEQVSMTDIHVISGSNSALPVDRKTPAVTIVSFHMAAVLHKQLLERPWKCVLVDESHTLHTNIDGVDARYTELIRTIGKRSEHCILLSGTPALTTPFDVFNQLDMLQEGLLGKTRWHFALRYCRMRLAPYAQVLDCVRPLEFTSALRKFFMIRRLKKDVLDLPAKNRVVLRVTSKQESKSWTRPDSFQRQYAECWRQKLQGILEAVAYVCDKYASVVLFAHHIALLDELSAALKKKSISYVRMDGSVDPQLRSGLIDRFSKGDVKVALIGLTACAVGISLSSASCAVFCELPPDAAWMAQAEDRLHRYGQKNEVTIYFLLGVSSVFDGKHFAELCRSYSRVRSVTDASARECPEELTFNHASRFSHAATMEDDAGRVRRGSCTAAAVHATARRLLFSVSPNTHRIHVKSDDSESPLHTSFSRDEVYSCLQMRSSPVWEQLAAFMDSMARLSPFEQRRLVKSCSWWPADFEWRRSVDVSRKRSRYASRTTSKGWGFWWQVSRSGFPVRYYYGSLSSGIALCLNCQRFLSRDADASRFFPGSVVYVSSDAEMFCSGPCREAYFVRRSSGAIRRGIQKEDGGVCANCHLDCEQLCQMAAEAKSLKERENLVRQFHPQLLQFPTLYSNFVESPTAGNLWHADHVVPVALGGGEATLDCIQTLCVVCHALKTREDMKAILMQRAKVFEEHDQASSVCTTVDEACARLANQKQHSRVTRRTS